MPIDHEFRRRRIKQVIDRDPWTISYTSRQERGASTSTGTFTARLFPASGYRGASRGIGVEATPSTELASHVILAEFDTPQLNHGDTLECTHDYSGAVRRLTVTFARQVGYKWEIECDEVS